jgi:hypothetical protein
MPNSIIELHSIPALFSKLSIVILPLMLGMFFLAGFPRAAIAVHRPLAFIGQVIYFLPKWRKISIARNTLSYE